VGPVAFGDFIAMIGALAFPMLCLIGVVLVISGFLSLLNR
jgi:hypothetical protein